MSEASHTPQHGIPTMPFSCYECRSRKLKCDRAKSQCSRCTDGGHQCVYPASRKRHVVMATRPKVKELESRLFELESRLKTSQDEAYQSFKPFQPSPEDLIETGRFEKLPPPSVVEDLTNIYFKNLHQEAPFLHPSRYLISLYLPPHMQPPMCLQYAVMASAAGISPTYSDLAQPFYRRARYYLEADELKGAGEQFITLAHAQCCVLMSHFEVKNLWFSRSSMSTSKSVRLAHILGLHQLDGPSDLGPTLAPPKDWCELEERRRTLWSIFCNDINTSSTTKWPCLMDAQKIRSLLPASDEAFENAIQEPSVTLNGALTHGSISCSAFACRILAAYFFHECLEHTNQDLPDPNPSNIETSTFWKRYRGLDNSLATTCISLPEMLRSPEASHDRTAVLVNLQLHTASICLHRIGVARAKKYNVSSQVLASTHARLFPAANAIFNIVATLVDAAASFQNPMVAFAAYMAAYVFLEDYKTSQNQQSEGKMGALLDLMITIGNQNTVTASLAVQMAYELRKTGIDPTALNKVAGLMGKMESKQPLMAKKDEATGSVVFCPFEMPKGAPAACPNGYSGF